MVSTGAGGRHRSSTVETGGAAGSNAVATATPGAGKSTTAPGMMALLAKPTGLHTFYHLQVLELKQNGIHDLGPLQNFANLRGLRFLNLEGNEISKLPTGCFALLENLRELILCKNRLRIVDEEDFFGLKALRELRMEDNGCRIFKFNAHLVPKLKSLQLANNRIQDIGNDLACSNVHRDWVAMRADNEKESGLDKLAKKTSRSGQGRSSLSQQTGGSSMLVQLDQGADGGRNAQDKELAQKTSQEQANGQCFSLLQLSCSNNPCARKPLYRSIVLAKFPNIKALDNQQLSEDERSRMQHNMEHVSSFGGNNQGPTVTHPLLNAPGGGAAGDGATLSQEAKIRSMKKCYTRSLQSGTFGCPKSYF